MILAQYIIKCLNCGTEHCSKDEFGSQNPIEKFESGVLDAKKKDLEDCT